MLAPRHTTVNILHNNKDSLLPYHHLLLLFLLLPLLPSPPPPLLFHPSIVSSRLIIPLHGNHLIARLGTIRETQSGCAQTAQPKARLTNVRAISLIVAPSRSCSLQNGERLSSQPRLCA